MIVHSSFITLRLRPFDKLRPTLRANGESKKQLLDSLLLDLFRILLLPFALSVDRKHEGLKTEVEGFSITTREASPC